MSDELNFKIGDEAVKTIIELRDQEQVKKSMLFSSKSMAYMEINLHMT